MIVSNFNNFHPKLKFTVELGGNSLNFLDASLKKNKTLRLVSPTFLAQYLNYFSCHSM